MASGTGGDLNVGGFWAQGFTGQGVTVAVVDDGIHHSHSDLKSNYEPKGSYDYGEGDHDPSPLHLNYHGTAVAGIISGKENGTCGVGVAYGAKVSGIRLFGGPLPRIETEQEALQYRLDTNDIYSSSWGQAMEQEIIRKLPEEIFDAIAAGARTGRKSRGAIYVFASGNGGALGNNCAFNGYSNSIYTITVGAVDKHDRHLDYSEGCAALLITGYSSSFEAADIYTTDYIDNKCKTNFTGVSAATPMVSGVIALALSKRPELTWRDVQDLLVKSARHVDPSHPSWIRTYTGRRFSNLYGYGVIDGGRLLSELQSHQLIEAHVAIKSQTVEANIGIDGTEAGVRSPIHVSRESLGKYAHLVLEHITVSLNIQTKRRKSVTVFLISPNGVKSTLVIGRKYDYNKEGYEDFKVLTLAHWGEPAAGIWTLHLKNTKSILSKAILLSWSIEMFGHIPREIKGPQISTTESPILRDFTEL